MANAATRGFVRDGEELKSGNSSASYTRSTLTVTMLKAAELSFDYRLSGPSQSGMEVKNGSKTLYTYSSYGSSGAEIVKGTDSGTATVQANAGDVITISYYRGWASSGSNCMWLSNFKASLPAQVIFHANDGTETTVQQGVFGSGTLQANTFQRDGYRFEGWATTPDGAVAYADKDSITITENTDLYAVWTRVYRVVFQLTPADAQFSLYGDEARTALIAADSGTAYTLAAGTYYYSVSAFGYAAVQGSVTVSGDAQEPVVLAEKPVVTVTFAYADGKDPADVGGYDLLAKLADMDKVTYQGLNGAIFALIALDSAGYEVPAAAEDANQTSREALVAYILDKQLSDGGWALSGDSADPDMTAMAVQALAAYRDDAAVQAAVDKAVQTLSDMQLSDGGYSSWGTVNSESCAQVIIALTTLGIDPAKDSRFIKYGLSLLDALCAYYKDGGFCHTRDGAVDDIATEQALCALTAYARLLNGQTALYDMTDLAAGITPAEPDAQEPAEEQEPAAQNGAVVWIVVAAAAAAAGAAVIAASKRRKKESGPRWAEAYEKLPLPAYAGRGSFCS